MTRKAERSTAEPWPDGGAGVDGAADGHAAVVDRLIDVLEAFRELDPDMPIQYALAFLTIARREGLSVRELSERLGIAQSSASRSVAALSEWHSFRKPGHRVVVAREDPRERRRKIVTLTPEGQSLLEKLEALMMGDRSAGTTMVRRPAGNPARPRKTPAEA